MFTKGKRLMNTVEIIDFIGSGGQGEVYRVMVNNRHMALKWYYPHMAKEPLKKSLENLISQGAPDENFLWPLALIEEGAQFGYLMELRPKGYYSLQDWVALEFDMNLSVIANVGYQLTNAFHKLHAKGLSYKDISFGNLFIDPIKGNILICDNDNITANKMQVTGLVGTPKFMAPEIVMGNDSPHTETDQFSLSILLFYLLCIAHPFEGEKEAKISCLDYESSLSIYGSDAVFIFDEQDSSNRPVPHLHKNAIELWKIYPPYIQSLFQKTFTIGIKNPAKRARETEWRQAFLQMSHSIMKCSHCGEENLYDQEMWMKQGKLDECIYCHHQFNIPPRMRIHNQIIVLDDQTKLGENMIDDNAPTNRSIIGKVTKEQTSFYLENVSQRIWNYQIDLVHKDVYPNQVIQLENNSILNFGPSSGEIQL